MPAGRWSEGGGQGACVGRERSMKSVRGGSCARLEWRGLRGRLGTFSLFCGVRDAERINSFDVAVRM